MNNTPAIILFITTTVFAALYLGAQKDIERRDQVIREMKLIMSSGQLNELEQRFETMRSLREPH